MFKQTTLLCLVLSMAGAGPVHAQATGSVAGVARAAENQVLSGVNVQVRNIDTGSLAGSTQSSASGSFSFAGLPAGNYVIEIVDAQGRVIGVSSSISVAGGAAISGVTVAASAAGAVAGTATSAGLSAFFSSSGGILALVGVGTLAAVSDGDEETVSD